MSKSVKSEYSKTDRDLRHEGSVVSEGSSLGSPPTYETSGLLRTGSEHGSSEDSQSESGPESSTSSEERPIGGAEAGGQPV
jgi:hypothetical protein